MKSLELKPTDENLLDAYTNNSIYRNEDLHRFIEILNAIDESCVIGLDGNWGSGKTFFVKQAKMILDAFNPFIEQSDDITNKIITTWHNFRNNESITLNNQLSVYYDAWENDSDDDPLLSIIYEILNQVQSEFDFEPTTKLLEIGASIAELITGKRIQKLLEAFSKHDPLLTIKKGKDLRDNITEFLDEIMAEKGDRLIIFIDELDRCKPSFAVKLLERIKHYLTNDRITFVLSVNTFELQNTIKQYYGSDFDGCRYLDRFFDLRIALPPADCNRYYKIINFDNDNYYCDRFVNEVVHYFKFELREIAKYIRWFKIAIKQNTLKCMTTSDATGFCFIVIVPILIGLKMYSIDEYYDFIKGDNSSVLINIVRNCYHGSDYCNSLLEGNETYGDGNTSKTHVEVKDKLNEVYRALFINDFEYSSYAIAIGSLRFDAKTRSNLFKTISLLSSFADYN